MKLFTGKDAIFNLPSYHGVPIREVEMSDDANRIAPQPEYDALHAFDAENNVEPARTIARRIAMKHDCGNTHPIVDDISHAIEDAMELGQRRAKHLPPRLRP